MRVGVRCVCVCVCCSSAALTVNVFQFDEGFFAAAFRTFSVRFFFFITSSAPLDGDGDFRFFALEAVVLLLFC